MTLSDSHNVGEIRDDDNIFLIIMSDKESVDTVEFSAYTIGLYSELRKQLIGEIFTAFDSIILGRWTDGTFVILVSSYRLTDIDRYTLSQRWTARH